VAPGHHVRRGGRAADASCTDTFRCRGLPLLVACAAASRLRSRGQTSRRARGPRVPGERSPADAARRGPAPFGRDDGRRSRGAGRRLGARRRNPERSSAGHDRGRGRHAVPHARGSDGVARVRLVPERLPRLSCARPHGRAAPRPGQGGRPSRRTHRPGHVAASASPGTIAVPSSAVRNRLGPCPHVVFTGGQRSRGEGRCARRYTEASS
jgi:hypothetical protein